MGLFLSVSGVIGGDQDEVISALGRYAEARQGSLAEESLKLDDEGCLVVTEEAGGVTVLYPGDFFDWDDASAFLSKGTGKPVFSFHIHDGDLWMYVLYDKGEVVDQFNPIPDYWKKLKEEKRAKWRGNANIVSQYAPNVSADSIAKYLVEWDERLLSGNQRMKAYPEDQFYYGDDWQLVDFMKRLGLDYPIDDHGEGFGTTYRFTRES